MTEVVPFNFDDHVEVLDINLVGFWNFNTHNNTCAICRNYIFEKVNNVCDNENHAVVGVCNHAFHYNCISNWLKTRPVCPLCNCKWSYLKVEKSN